MTPPCLRRAARRLGRALGSCARRLGLGSAVTSAATAVLRRLEPRHPLLREDAERRALAACANDASRASLDAFLTHRRERQ